METPVNPITPAACLITSIPVTRFKDAIFIPLPVELWRATPGGGCCCQLCKADGSPGFWDTLAIAAVAPAGDKHRDDRTYTVHHPGLHAPHIRKERAARAAASHPFNDLAGNGYCFDCGLEKAHPEAHHPESEVESPTPESQPSTELGPPWQSQR